ncbi:MULTISPECIES: YfcC family protein [unclassified Romboutsia]|uniref:YfcC family protein n=1 Tax=unclassified Romboutsia TaxID=2626894 RepID=UPI0008213231|nr:MULTISPECIES: Na+/H+ antiporter NhaC family protein [unclassified Romboutsia]SCH44804.1 C4-dicarboxylate anaerobic carrier [uncultured Clostridium sp.]
MELSKIKQQKNSKIDKKGIKVPHTLVIIASIIMIVSIATYFIPGGKYETVINEAGKYIVVDGSFKYIESQPQNLFKILQAPIQGIIDGAEIIAFLFIIGGAFNLIAETRAIDFGIVRIVNLFKGKEILLLPIIIFSFSLGGATFGMSEESVAFISILAPLTLALGYDSIVAVAITSLACTLGFSSAMLNPFTVGIAQSIAGIQLYSGIEFRTIIWFMTTAVGTAFIMAYAVKVKKNPEISTVYESDQVKRKSLQSFEERKDDFTLSHKFILLTFAIAIGVIVWGVLDKGFWISEIGAVFLAVGFISGVLGKLSLDQMANAFIEGAKGMIGPAIMIGFARGIMIIAENANIIDTILYNLSNIIGNLPSLLAAYVMYPIQMFINFFINSGSGQAALTMPILAPLGDLVGISRQLTVLIYQLGDGFSNAMFPTSGVLIACLGIAGVPYGKWLKWIIPLQIILFICSIGFITIASLIGWA